MSITITRPMNSTADDPFEILLEDQDVAVITLHCHDRIKSDRLLIALLENLSSMQIRS